MANTYPLVWGHRVEKLHATDVAATRKSMETTGKQAFVAEDSLQQILRAKHNSTEVEFKCASALAIKHEAQI